MNNNAEAEQEEEFSEWVVIQTSPTNSSIDASSPLNSPISQASQGHDDEDSVVPVVEQEDDESSSTVNQSFPCWVIESAKKRLKDSRFFERASCNYVSSTRVFWSFTLICGFSLVSSLVYVKVVRWWRRLHEEKLRFVLLQLREKDQKIKELILEIGRLNETLSSRRRVRVVRIV
ncbi:Transmembrane protein [Hirschfeldia incana]|nr:Transmembrane protein [Hirschfeldia incana]